MGDYEDRYPEAYGRGDEAKPPADKHAEAGPPRQVRDAPIAGAAAPAASSPRPPTAPAEPHAMRREGPHRGRGPRGYRRTSERILEDLCDRLTEDPFVDASEIEVQVNGTEVLLAGIVDDWTAQRQAQSIAQDVAGVTRVVNNLRVAAHLTEPSPGGAVNAALSGHRPR
jgi:hypothetical protein